MIDTQREAATIWALDFDAELPCESSHSEAMKFCSGKSVGIKSRKCRADSITICKNSYNWNATVIADNSNRCANCKKPVAECWSIRPI